MSPFNLWIRFGDCIWLQLNSSTKLAYYIWSQLVCIWPRLVHVGRSLCMLLYLIIVYPLVMSRLCSVPSSQLLLIKYSSYAFKIFDVYPDLFEFINDS